MTDETLETMRQCQGYDIQQYITERNQKQMQARDKREMAQ